MIVVWINTARKSGIYVSSVKLKYNFRKSNLRLQMVFLLLIRNNPMLSYLYPRRPAGFLQGNPKTILLKSVKT